MSTTDSPQAPQPDSTEGRKQRSWRLRPEGASTRDYVVTGVIAAVVVIVAASVLGFGTAASAKLTRPAGDVTQPQYRPSELTPTGLHLEWQAPTTAVGAPLVSDGNVYTTSEHGITAWEAGFAHEQWKYERPAALCGATFFDSRVVTVFAGRQGCSDVTSFDAGRGTYDNTRQSAFAKPLTLWTTYSHVLALGPKRLEVWRNDLVRTVEYGEVDAPQEPNMQPRSGCELHSATLNSAHFAVTESCPDSPRTRLTISKAVPEDSRQPEEQSSVVTDFDELHLIGLTESTSAVAVARKGSDWSIQLFPAGRPAQELTRLPGAPAQLPNPATVAQDPALFRWFDGSSAYAFDARDGHMRWTANGVTGPGHGLGYALAPSDQRFTPKKIMMPGQQTLNFVDAQSGAIEGTIALDAKSAKGQPVGLSQIGNILYVQFDGTLRAYLMQGS